MALSLAQKFISLGMPSPLAVEFANQLTTGVYNWKRLMWNSMVPDLAKYLADSLAAGTFDPRKAMELSMTEAVANLTVAGWSPKALGLVASRSYFSPETAGAFGTPAQTFIGTWAFEEAYDRIEVMPLNYGTVAITDLVMAVGSTETDDVSTAARRSNIIVGGVTYTGLAANASSPGMLRFNGGDPISIPARTSAYDPGYASQWYGVDVNSVPRADGGIGCLARLRAYTAGNISVAPGTINNVAGGGFNGNDLIAWNNAVSATAFFRSFRSVSLAGDGVANLALTGTAANSALAFLIRARHSRKSLTVLSVGDSQMAVADNGRYSTAMQRACAAMAALGAPAYSVNYADSGETEAVFGPPGIVAESVVTPDVVHHHLHSPNSGSPTAVSNVSDLARLDATIVRAKAARRRVIIRECTPNGSWNVTADGFRLALNAAAATRADNKWVWYAALPGLSDGATPARMPAPMTVGDGTHNSEAGMTYEASVYTTILQSIIA